MIDETRGDSTGQKPHDLLPDDATMIAEAKAELKRLDAHCLGANTIVLGRTLMALERAVDRIAELRSGSTEWQQMQSDLAAMTLEQLDRERAIAGLQLLASQARPGTPTDDVLRIAAALLRRDAEKVEAWEVVQLWGMKSVSVVDITDYEDPRAFPVYEATVSVVDGYDFVSRGRSREAAILAAAAKLQAESEVQDDE